MACAHPPVAAVYDHLASPAERGRVQDSVQPLWSALTTGCRPNRDSVARIAAAGFRLVELELYVPDLSLPILFQMAEGVAVR